jgi:hypothetical protein
MRTCPARPIATVRLATILPTAASALLLPLAAMAQCPGAWASGAFSIGNVGMPNTVNAVATGLDGSIFAAGVFASAGGTAASNVARWNGVWSALGTGLNSTAFAAAVASNGDLIVAGQFTTAGGVAANRIARWNGSTWSALGSGMNDTIFALAIKANNEIVAAGNFTTAGGNAANRVARWNGTTWIPLGSGLDGQVNALAVLPNGDVVAGGTFLNAGGSPASGIARFDGSGWLPLPGTVGEGVNTRVRSLAAMDDGSVVVGGFFSVAGGVAASNIARWSPVGGGTWAPMGAGLSNEVWGLRVLRSGTLMAGGDFVTDGAGGGALNRIARWDGTGWQPLGAGANGRVRSVTGTNLTHLDTIVAGGEFTTAGGATAVRVAQFNAGASPTITIQPAPSAEKCGSTARFVALAAPAPVSYQWRRNGINLSNGPTGAGSTVAGATSPILTITSVAAADAAAYDCVVTLNGGCAVTTSAAALSTSGCCPADFDGNTVINPSDVANFVNAWFAALAGGC